MHGRKKSVKDEKNEDTSFLEILCLNIKSNKINSHENGSKDQSEQVTAWL